MCSKIKNHNVNRLVSLLAFICLTSFTYTYAGGSGQGAAVHTLVIDPGHGGMDPGAIGPGGHHESDLALAVSLKFGEMVKAAFPNVKIIYTRTTDKFVSLADRADMANKAKADLFICIHLNSATTHEAYGTATYVLGLHRTDDNLEVAKRENAVIELEGDKDKNYEFDPNSPEGHIIMSMKQNAFLDQSILIASKIEDELAVLSKRKSHGVKQAGFWVLYKTAMPSLLAEIGFISNPTEEQYLATDEGQKNIATSIFKAFRSYKYEIEGIKDTASQSADIKKADITPTTAIAQSKPHADTTTPAANADVRVFRPDTLLLAEHTPKKADTAISAAPTVYKPIGQMATMISDTHSIVQNGKVQIDHEASRPKTEKKLVPIRDDKGAVAASPEPQAVTADTDKPQETPKPKTDAPTYDTIKNATASIPEIKQAPKPKEPEKHIATTQVPVKAGEKESVYFTVQLLAAKRKPDNYDDLVNTFGLIDREDIGTGIIRYMAGEYPNFTDAKKALDLAHAKGIKDAFIVGYLNKKRLDGVATYQLGKRYP